MVRKVDPYSVPESGKTEDPVLRTRDESGQSGEGDGVGMWKGEEEEEEEEEIAEEKVDG